MKQRESAKWCDYPPLWVCDTLITLAVSKWFLLLTWKVVIARQVELHPENQEKSVFAIGDGLWQFTVKTLEVTNATATFERLMKILYKGLSSEPWLVYLDDIVVTGKSSFNEHLENMEKVVFSWLRPTNLKVTAKKCNLFRIIVKFLGHVISKEGVYSDKLKP